MVIRWRKIGRLQPDEVAETPHGTALSYDSRWVPKMFLSGMGGLMTATVMVIFAVTKFAQGAWIVLLLIPALVFLFFGIHRHYQFVARKLSMGGLDIHPYASPVLTILLVDDVHAGTLRLVNFAQSLGNPWEAVHVQVDPERSAALLQKWASRIGVGELKLLPSPYRSISEPLREYITEKQQEDPEQFIHLLVGQLAFSTYWEQVLHRNTNLLIDLVLRDMDRVVITSVPYQIDQRAHYEMRAQSGGRPEVEEPTGQDREEESGLDAA